MVDYTEKATLLIVDRSSGAAKKINDALRGLRKEAKLTADALNRIKPNQASINNLNKMSAALRSFSKAANSLPPNQKIGVKLAGTKAADIRSMARALDSYKSASKNVNPIVGLGGKQANFKNLDDLVTKLVKVARAANLAAQKLAQVNANIPKVKIPGMNLNPRNRQPANPAFPRSIGLEIQPFKSFWRSAAVSMGHTITNAIQEGFAIGVKGFDIAANKMSQQRLLPMQRSEFERRANDASRANPLLRADQRLDLYAEIATNYRDPMDALRFDESIDRAIKVAVQQGQSAQDASEGLAAFFRGLGQAGYLQDNQGNFNPEVKKYIDAYTAAKVSEGAQINWNDAMQLLKYARTAGQSITPKEFFTQLVAAADVGASTAGVQLNQAVKNFAGETTKKAIKAQEAGGLREPGNMVLSGQIGNRKSYTYEAGNLKDEELFRENPTQWIAKNILGPGGFLERQGLDPLTASNAQIISALDPLAGNRNVDDFLAKAVLQLQERLIKANKYFDNPLTDPELNNISQQSSYVQLQETTNQLITLFGTLGDKLENTFIPVIDYIGNSAQKLTDILQGKSRGEVQDYAFLGAAGATGIAGGIGAVKILQLLSSGFGLIPAATALNGSATNLNSAAAALTRSAAAGGSAPGAPNLPGKGSNRNARINAGTIIANAILTSTTGLSLPEHEQQAQDSFKKNKAAWDQLGDWLQKTIGTPRSWIYGDEDPTTQAAEKAAMNRSALDETIAKISQVQADINDAKARGNDAYAMVKQNELSTLEQYAGSLRDQIASGAAELQSTFEGGASRIEQATDNFGNTAAENILGVANSFGSTAGEAMRRAFGNIAFSVPLALQPQAAPNTGTNTNLATGG